MRNDGLAGSDDRHSRESLGAPIIVENHESLRE